MEGITDKKIGQKNSIDMRFEITETLLKKDYQERKIVETGFRR